MKTPEAIARDEALFALPNETKIAFCNAHNAMMRHAMGCAPCAAYLMEGDGDLCDSGKHIIAENLYAAETTPIKPILEAGKRIERERGSE